MKKVILLISVIITSIICFTNQTNDVHSSTSGAPAGRTGSPGDGSNCTIGCHSGSPVSGSPNAAITSTIPSSGYIPGQTYTVTGTVTGAGLVKFGFEISPQNAAGALRGTPVITDNTNTQITGTKYVTHKTAGTTGTTGSHTWSFNWIAPAAGTGSFSFYGAFNATNNMGNSSGDIIYLTSLPIAEAAQIATQPTAQAVCAGGTATFTVVATGTNISYLWKKNGTPLSNGGNIAGATNATLTISNVSIADQNTYTVDVTGSGNTITSNSVALTVNPATIIGTQPQGQSLCEGSTLNLSVAATGTGNLTYQWKRGTTVVGTNSPNLTLNNITTNDAGSYTCVVTGSCGNATSNAAVITVTPQTVLNSQPPVSQSVCQGANISIVANAGGQNLSYVWKRGVTVVGTNSTVLNINNATANDNGQYTCTITGDCGTVTTNASAVTVIPTTAITTQPISQSACVGASATFTVVATGNNLTYQWKKGGNNINGQTAASLTLNNVSNIDAANYTCEVYGSCDTVTSNIAALSLGASASISQQPQSQTICIGNPFTLTVVGNSGNNTSYQWFRNNQPVGSNSATFTVPAATINSAGNYKVTITGDCGTITSNIATLSIGTTTAVNNIFTNTQACEGEAYTIGLSADGTNLSYQWLFNSNPLANETSATLNIPSLVEANSGLYQVLVNGDCGNIAASISNLDVISLPQITGISLPLPFCQGSAVDLIIQTTGDNLAYQWYKNATEIPGANDVFYSDPAPANNDVYLCKVWNTCDTITSSPITVTVLPAPVVTITQTGSNQLTASGSFIVYQWLDANLDFIPGANTSTFTPPFVPGNFYVTITDSNGCVDTSDIFFYFPESVSESPTTKISIYPNPTNGDLFISKMLNNEPYSLRIYNATGQLVLQKQLQSNYVNIATLPAGMYTVLLSTDKYYSRHRLLKE